LRAGKRRWCAGVVDLHTKPRISCASSINKNLVSTHQLPPNPRVGNPPQFNTTPPPVRHPNTPVAALAFAWHSTPQTSQHARCYSVNVSTCSLLLSRSSLLLHRKSLLLRRLCVPAHVPRGRPTLCCLRRRSIGVFIHNAADPASMPAQAVFQEVSILVDSGSQQGPLCSTKK
jgi:hypothetical protein